MSKAGSADVWLLVDGYNLLAQKLKTLRYKIGGRTEPTHGLGDVSEDNTPTGISYIELEQGGAFFDTTALSGHAAFAASLPTTPQATPRVAVFGFTGNAIGELFLGVEGLYSHEYEVLGENGNLTKANAAFRCSGQIDRGVIVQHLTAQTVDWNTKTLGTPTDYTLNYRQVVIPITSNSLANPSVVTTPVPHGLATNDIILISGVTSSSPTINGERTVTVISTTSFSVPVNVTNAGVNGSFVRANSSGGGVGYQEITALTGLTGFVGKIRDSADDTTYADLVTFGNVTAAPDAERQVVAGVIDRYLSFDGNVTGTGSITAFAGFARTFDAV